MSVFKRKLFVFLVIVFSGSSNAALMTTTGNTVSFTYDDMLLGLFGSPTISGDSLFFTPSNFKALRENKAGGKLVSSTFSVRIDSLQGGAINSVALTEKGDYLLEGAKAKVAVLGELRAVDVADPFTTYSANITSASPFTETAFTGPTGKWTASAYLDLPGVSSVIVNIENILRAKIDRGNTGDELAFIEKKFAGLSVTTVPLPQAVWLFGAGLFGLLSVSKRKKYI